MTGFPNIYALLGLTACTLFGFSVRGLSESTTNLATNLATNSSSDHQPTVVTTAPPASWSVALHPLAEANRKESWLRNLIHGQLIALDKQWKWQCQLCVNLPSASNGLLRLSEANGRTPKNSRQNLVIDFEIPAQAKWGDGKPVTAGDFILALKIAWAMPASTKSGNLARSILKFTADIKNNKRFSAHLRNPRGDFWFAFGFRPVPSHLEAEVWKASEGNYQDYIKATTYVTDPMKAGLYSGPWFPKTQRLRVAGARPFVLLEANPAFGGGKVQTSALVIRFQRDERAAVADLEGGNADIIPETDLTLSGFNLITRKDTQRSALGTELEHIDFNMRNPLLTDINLRKAISLLINRHDLARVTGMPPGLPMALGFLHPGLTGLPLRTDRGDILNAKVFQHPVWGYAPSEAIALLQQSGWIRETSKIWTKEGTPLEVDLDTSQVDHMRSETVRTLVRQLTDAGIKVTVREHAADVFLRDTLRKVKFKYLAAYAWRMPPGTVPDGILESRQIPSLQNGYSGENTTGWGTRAVDEILEKLGDEWDPTARLELLRQIETLTSTDVPFIPLYYRPLMAGAASSLSGFDVPGHEGWSSGMAKDWIFAK